MIYKTNTPEETQKIAQEFAKMFQEKGGVIALSGDLGAGKTTFTQGFARGLGIKDKVTSPTFVLVRQHLIPNTERTIYHIDLYRLEGEINTKETGLDEIIESSDQNIVLIEWAEKIQNKLPKNIHQIKITKTGESGREISINQLS